MLLVYAIFTWKGWMARAAKNVSETFTLKILHMLNHSPCSELKSRRKQDQGLSVLSSHHCTYFTKQGMKETGIRWSETPRLGMWREKELSPHTSISHSYFVGNRIRHFSAGWVGAEDGCCSSCRDTDSVGWLHETANCHDTGADRHLLVSHWT